MTSTAVTPTDEDKAAAAGVPQRVVAAWAKADADAFAGVFTEDGTMVLPGVYCKGRKEIRDFMAAGFAGPYKGTQLTGKPMDVRFIDAATGVLISRGGVIEAGKSDLSADREVNASWIVVWRDGQWQLAAYHNSPRDEA